VTASRNIGKAHLVQALYLFDDPGFAEHPRFLLADDHPAMLAQRRGVMLTAGGYRKRRREDAPPRHFPPSKEARCARLKCGIENRLSMLSRAELKATEML
jgi:hypothetical protein